MGVLDSIRAELRAAKRKDNRIVIGEVTNQSNGNFDVTIETDQHLGLEMLRPFNGFLTASRATGAAVVVGDHTPFVVGYVDGHVEKDPKGLRSYSW